MNKVSIVTCRLRYISIGVLVKTAGSSTSTTTRWVFNEQCQAQCRLCFVPGWMLCFEFTVFGIFHTFLVLIVNATEVERGQQKSAREKPSEKAGKEFEHGPRQREEDDSSGIRHKLVYAWAKRLCPYLSLGTGPECCFCGRGKKPENRSPAAASRF